MKKFTFFLSLVVAFVTATAQEVTVTSLDQLSNDKTYFIESARCFLMNNTTANAGGISTNNAKNLGTSTVKKDWNDANQQFKIEAIDGNYYLYSVGAGKYVAKDGSWSDAAVDALEITPSSNNTYNWKLCIAGNGMNSQVPGQMDHGIVVNSWTSEDAGNCYKILDTEASVLVVVDYPNELTEFDQNKCYTVTTTGRGGWAAKDGQFCSTNDAGLGTNSNPGDPNQQFAVLSIDGENYYLYSVGAQMFVNSDKSLVAGIGEAIELTDASSQGDCRVRVNFKGYTDKYINLGGSNQMLVDSWGTIDGGNAVAFIEAGEFDPTDALEMLQPVVADPLVPTKATRNPAESALSPDNMYKLAGVKLDFAENIKKAEGVTVWGKIVDANGNEVAVLDKIMGGTSWFATPYTSTPVTVAGTYKVVVNAGVFTSVDGSKVYQGGEYEFTVQGQPVTMIPAADEGFFYGETFTTVEEFLNLQIRIKGAAEVALTGEAQITMTQGENEYVAELTITEEDGDKLINIAFPADAEYAEGRYTVNVPAGVFTINGTANEAFVSSSFTYSTPKLKITKDWTSWEKLFTAKYMMPREVAITINNADEVTVAEGLFATLAVGETTYNSTVEFTNEGNNYWISFHFAEVEAIYEDENVDFIKGEYTFTVPAGLYTVNGEANVEETRTFTYGDAVVAEFSVKSITPAPGTVLSLDQIALSFTNTTKPDQLVVTSEAGDKFFFISKDGAYVAVDPLANYAETPITEAGKYTLDLSELEGLVGRKVFTWIVNPNAVMPTEYLSTNEYVPYQLPGIKLVFDEKVTAADLAEGETSYGYILNAAGEKVLELNKKGYISGSMKYVSFTNDNMDYVEGAGDYTVVITATITFESGNVYNGGEFVLTVTKQPAEITMDVDLWGTLDAMPTTINITVDNVETIALDETKKATLTIGTTVYEAVATLNGNVITLAFPEDVEYANGSYTLVVPEGFFTYDGEASQEIWEQFTYKKPVPLKIIAVTPAEGEVESIEKITIVFNQEINASWEFEMNSTLFVRTDGWAASATIEYTASVYDPSIWDYAPSPATAPGEYVLNIGSVTEMALAEGEKATYTWTIAEAVEPEPEPTPGEVDYTPDFTGTKTRTGRNITSVSLGENTYSLLTPEQSSCYVDATETVTFTVEAGATVKAIVAYQGEWMHHAVFIDFDGDGFTSGIEEGSEWKPAGDLVAYSFYNNGGSSDEYGYNSIGTYMSGMDRHVPEIPEFAVPTTPGTYRIRFVQDWCSIDPNGDADGKFEDFMANGGQIVDVTLVVTEPTGIENVETVEVKAIYDLTGRKIETITKAGIYIVNGKKVLVK